MGKRNYEIVVIFGTRPEVIKLWPVIREARAQNLKVTTISTGQQRDLLVQTLEDLGIVADISIAPPDDGATVEDFVAKTLIALTKIFSQINPNLVIVQGDTGSATAGALAAYYSKIPVGHVEAGLRSNDLYAPWPEEGNRRIIDSISRILWVPTLKDASVGIGADQELKVVGNTVVDALKIIIAQIGNEISSNTNLPVLITLHRRESFGKPMVKTLAEIVRLSENISNPVIFLQHPNPNVDVALRESNFRDSNVQIISPMRYSEFIRLLSKSALLITDSGGLQEEAVTLGIPFLVARDKTERSSGISEELNSRLIGADGEQLYASAIEYLKIRRATISMRKTFGDGDSSKRIVSDVLRICSELEER